MFCDRAWHESFLIRLWAEPDGEEVVLRGAVQNVQTGNTTYFSSLELPLGLIREAAERVALAEERIPIG